MPILYVRTLRLRSYVSFQNALCHRRCDMPPSSRACPPHNFPDKHLQVLAVSFFWPRSELELGPWVGNTSNVKSYHSWPYFNQRMWGQGGKHPSSSPYHRTSLRRALCGPSAVPRRTRAPLPTAVTCTGFLLLRISRPLFSQSFLESFFQINYSHSNLAPRLQCLLLGEPSLRQPRVQ